MSDKPMPPEPWRVPIPSWLYDARNTSQDESKRCRAICMDWLLFCFIRHVDIANPRNDEALQDLFPAHIQEYGK